MTSLNVKGGGRKKGGEMCEEKSDTTHVLICMSNGQHE